MGWEARWPVHSPAWDGVCEAGVQLLAQRLASSSPTAGFAEGQHSRWGQHARPCSAPQAGPPQVAVLSLTAAQLLALSASWTLRDEWEMVPGFKEFADEGAEKQWGCVWLWNLPGSLSQTVCQGFHDACCVLFLSSEIEVGPSSLTLPCAFIPAVFMVCAVLLWMLRRERISDDVRAARSKGELSPPLVWVLCLHECNPKCSCLLGAAVSSCGGTKFLFSLTLRAFPPRTVIYSVFFF